ncbi:Uncharacterised protein [uncultured archaeon]|nr:Uncharacterised protein [uncultured archaeon]
MKTIEEKLEALQVMLERLELKVHRKIMEREHEKELPLTHSN